MKTDIKLVSILIVTFNAENYITKTIKSCLKQTYKKIEILILDNKSTDNTVNLIKKFKSSKIKLIENDKNIGPYLGLNVLLDHAKGEYIAIQDHDDIWLPQKIFYQAKYMSKNTKEVACGTRTYVYYENKSILIADKRPLKVNYVHHVSLFFRNNNYRYDTKFLLCDEHFEKVILTGNKNKIHCIPKILSIHRIRDDRNNLSRNRFIFNKRNIREIFFINTSIMSSIINLIGIFISKYVSPEIEWFIINNILKKKAYKITLSRFNKTYPNLI